jgi:transposase
VKEIQKQYLQRRFARPKLRHVRLRAIDEITNGHGHRYLTVVLDLESGGVVFVGDGRHGDALRSFFRCLRASRAKVEAVAMDMSGAHLTAVRTHLPGSTVVFDHFPVIKLFNEKLTGLRRNLYHEATDLLHKKVLKGTRWLLVRNSENLDPKHNERQRLEEALRLNKLLATAYYMKDDLRELWKCPDKLSAEIHLDNWTTRAEASGMRMLKEFAKTLRAHRAGILAYYDHPISSGPLEDTNNKIKTMQRQAYGFRDPAFFILKIYALHLTR